jgi:arsenate reductase
MTSPTTCEVYFNPGCSKCRALRERLEQRGVEATYREYLTQPPSRDELWSVMKRLGIDDPRAMMRTDDPIYPELRLEAADVDALIAAMVAHPQLLQRPIVIAGDRAVIARPIETVDAIL